MRNFGLILTLLLFSFGQLFPQNSKIFVDKKGKEHLWGTVSEKDIKSHKTHQEWYKKHYEQFEIEQDKLSNLDMLKKYTIVAYFGSWCGDSKVLLPPFLKIMNELGLQKNVQIIGLHRDGELYKKGPNGEEKLQRIHRVPTFIFESEGEEVARIVESAANDLYTDLNQIALGFPSVPNYRIANWLMKELNEKDVKDLNQKAILKKARRQVKSHSELNTLGYIYLTSKEYDKALFILRLNTKLFPNEPNTHDSLAECYMEMGDNELAIQHYLVAQEKNPTSKHIIQQLAKLYSE